MSVKLKKNPQKTVDGHLGGLASSSGRSLLAHRLGLHTEQVWCQSDNWLLPMTSETFKMAAPMLFHSDEEANAAINALEIEDGV